MTAPAGGGAGPTDAPGLTGAAGLTDVGLTDGFWAAAASGRLVRPVCKDCGRSFFVPSWCCPSCRSPRWGYAPSSGRGTVYSHTTVHRGPDPSWEVPYLLGIVDLDEGWTMLSRLLVDPSGESEPGWLIGEPVEVRFVPEDRPPHRTLPAFALLGKEPFMGRGRQLP